MRSIRPGHGLPPKHLSDVLGRRAASDIERGTPLSWDLVSYGPTEAEKKSLRFRRSLYVAKDLKAGDVLTPENLRCVRPGMGLPPKYFDLLLGRRVNQDVKKGMPMGWGLLFEQEEQEIGMKNDLKECL